MKSLGTVGWKPVAGGIGLAMSLWVSPGYADEGGDALQVDLFISVDCPIANAYVPEINRLHARFAPRGVKFRLVYPESGLAASEMARHRKAFALVPEGTLDPRHALVERAGATVTPEVAVFDARGKLRYRGKIDNLFTDYGEKRRVVTEKYLEDALSGLLSGEGSKFREFKAVGCLIEPVSR